MNESAPKRSFALITRKWALLAALCALPLFFVFAYFGDPGRGMAAAGSAGMIALAVRYFWDLKRHTWFWVTVAFIVVVHVLLVTLVPWPDRRYNKMQFLPFGLLDFGVSYGIIKLVERAVDKDSAKLTTK